MSKPNPIAALNSFIEKASTMGWTSGYVQPDNVAATLVKTAMFIKSTQPRTAEVFFEGMLKERERFEKVAVKRAVQKVDMVKFKSMDCDGEIAKLSPNDQYRLGVLDAVIGAFYVC
jgi:hypothetical protein